MSLQKELLTRANNLCELCAAKDNLNSHAVPEAPTGGLDGHVLICKTCQEQFDGSEEVDANHWRCLNDSMWNTEPAVQVVVWRMLHRLRGEGWPQSLLDMIFIEPDTLKWAKATEDMDGDEIPRHKDSNGQLLLAGDTVMLIQDLNVKGANFTAKRGTSVRRITLSPDNTEHIEGKVNGQNIVLLTKYVKKM